MFLLLKWMWVQNDAASRRLKQIFHSFFYFIFCFLKNNSIGARGLQCVRGARACGCVCVYMLVSSRLWHDVTAPFRLSINWPWVRLQGLVLLQLSTSKWTINWILDRITRGGLRGCMWGQSHLFQVRGTMTVMDFPFPATLYFSTIRGRYELTKINEGISCIKVCYTKQVTFEIVPLA